MAELTDSLGRPLAREEVEGALEHALASPVLAGSRQLSDFLKYVVQERLAGREKDIKAYSIAVDALGREESFDPQENAMVRVAAGRLRRALALYNADAAPEIAISLEPGSYVPVFERKVDGKTETSTLRPEGVDAPPAAEPPDGSMWPSIAMPTLPEVLGNVASVGKPSGNGRTFWMATTIALAILAIALAGMLGWILLRPAERGEARPSPVILSSEDALSRPRIAATLLFPDPNYPDWFNRGVFADSISFVVSRFDDYRFMGTRVLRQPVLNGQFDADYHILVTAYRRGEKVRFFGQLIREADGAILWSTSRLFADPDQRDGRDVPAIIGALFAPLASPHGVIYSDLRKSDQPRPGLDCVVKAQQYFYRESDAAHLEARTCLERQAAQGSRLPSVHAALTFVTLEEYREERNARPDALKRAERHAERARQLGPLSARAHQALFAVHKVKQHRDLARSYGATAVELNPYDTDILSDYAAWLISIGEVEAGRAMLERAQTLLDTRPAWVEFYRFLGAELSRDFRTADALNEMMDVTASPLLALAVAIGAARRGEAEKAAIALAEIGREEPMLRSDPRTALQRRGFDPGVIDQLVKALKRAETLAASR